MPARDYYDTTEEIKSIGSWTWKDTLLWRKVQATTDDACWSWLGSTSPHANLFGARKNNKPQMTQAPRLIWASIHNQDIEHLEVRHTCGNRFCCNPKHLFAVPNHMRYRRDGSNLTSPPQPKARTTVTRPAPRPEITTKQWWQL